MALPPLPLRERRVFVDSSAYLALLDTDDEHYREAVATLQELAQARYRQFTTNVLLIESHALILSVLGRARAAQFLKDMQESNTVVIRARSSDPTLTPARYTTGITVYKIITYGVLAERACMEAIRSGV